MLRAQEGRHDRRQHTLSAAKLRNEYVGKDELSGGDTPKTRGRVGEERPNLPGAAEPILGPQLVCDLEADDPRTPCQWSQPPDGTHERPRPLQPTLRQIHVKPNLQTACGR